MTTYQPAGDDGLEMGDICAGRFFADVPSSGRTVRVVELGPVSKEDKEVLPGRIFMEAPSGAGELVVTRGMTVERVVAVSDSCDIETALGRGGADARGWIWFAPVRRLTTENQIQQVRQARRAFGRLMLEPDDPPAEGYWSVELRQSFRVPAAAIRRALEQDRAAFLVSSLDGAVVAELRMRWAALTVRVGPMVAESNLDHLIDRLEECGVEAAEAEAATSALAAVAWASWNLEGGSLEGAGALPQEATQRQVADALDEVIANLTGLRASVDDALGVVGPLRARL